MNLPDQLVDDIIKVLPQSQRQTILNTIHGVNTHRVYCDSKVKGRCRNRFVGYMQSLNGERRFEPIREDDGKMYIRSWRPRLDGQFGFLCWCGNDTRISKHEEGEFDHKGRQPDKAGYEKIFNRLQVSPPGYTERNGKTLVDGFRLEAI